MPFFSISSSETRKRGKLIFCGPKAVPENAGNFRLVAKSKIGGVTWITSIASWCSGAHMLLPRCSKIEPFKASLIN